MLILILSAIPVIVLFALTFWTVDSAQRRGGEPDFDPTYRAYGA